MDGAALVPERRAEDMIFQGIFRFSFSEGGEFFLEVDFREDDVEFDEGNDTLSSVKIAKSFVKSTTLFSSNAKTKNIRLVWEKCQVLPFQYTCTLSSHCQNGVLFTRSFFSV